MDIIDRIRQSNLLPPHQFSSRPPFFFFYFCFHEKLQDSTRVFRKVFVYAPASAGPAVAAMLKVIMNRENKRHHRVCVLLRGNDEK